jgi:hypothetical protein
MHHAACIGQTRTANTILVGQPEGKRLIRRPMHKRRENNSETDLEEITCEGEDWIYLAQDRNKWRALVDTAMIFSDCIERWEILDRDSTRFSKRLSSMELVS